MEGVAGGFLDYESGVLVIAEVLRERGGTNCGLGGRLTCGGSRGRRFRWG